MSVAILEQPNDFDLFCNSLTANEINGGGSTGTTFDRIVISSTGAQILPALTINNTNTVNSTDIIQINCQNPESRFVMKNTNPASTSNQLSFVNNAGNEKLICGNNNSDGNTYLYAYNSADLKFGTNGTERLRIQNAGIPASTSSSYLVLNGTVLSTNTDISTTITGLMTGPWGIGPTVTLKLYKSGNFVTISLTSIETANQGGVGAIMTFPTALPIAYRPIDPAQLLIPMYILDSGYKPGTLQIIPSTGAITFGLGVGSPLSGIGAGGLPPFTVTYDISN